MGAGLPVAIHLWSWRPPSAPRYAPGVTAPLDALLTRSKLLREWTLQVVGDLSDEQLGWRPSPVAHSIGWTLWHIARADDNFQRDLTGRSIWKEGGYRESWGFSSDKMNRMQDEAAAAMRMPPKEALLGYVREVFAATDRAVEHVDEQRFGEEIESGFMSRRCAVGDAYLASLSHDGRHLGEIEYIKGLQGLPGTATV